MILNRDIKILVGFIFSLMIFVSLRDNPIQDFQDDIIPQHYNLEFIDYSDQMICNVIIFFQFTQDRFALLHQYECYTMDILQLCLPRNLFNYTLNTTQIFETYFSRTFPLNKLTLITVLESNDRIISKPGLVFIDQNILLTNISTKQILQQHESIFFLIAYQWVDTLIQFNNKNQWIGKSLARSIARHLFNKTNNPIEKFMSTVIIDSLCNTESDEKINNIM
ncbi:unnamed protein product [Adineta steineri]|uniref:Uncharacterized protein n=1 Tax=Adineta steineri TaxID=433720 RepID=A0A815XIG5_9BILA|nr:unnamed protein product [Adineta steineri]CAF1557921.1 unnamed protein product [Adineta steineri]